MKSIIIIVTLCIFCYAFADVNELKAKEVPIISEASNIDPDGTFHYAYETGDGTKAQEDGSLRQIGDLAGEVVQGQYSYVGDDGQTYSVQYIADENGFQPQGAHIPTVPPIPESVQKTLDYIAAHPPVPTQ